MPVIQLEFQSTLASTPASSLSLSWLENEMTAAELIRRTVTEQCRQLAERHGRADARARIARQYLSDADIDRMQQEGRIAMPATTVESDPDTATETAIALEAFRRRRFLLLVGERQIRAEDDIITLTPHQPIRFVRLIPLQGG